MSDQQQEAGAQDDLSGLSGFFFYVFIVHPMTAWILRPGRFERRKSIMYAIAFLAGLAAIKTGKFTQVLMDGGRMVPCFRAVSAVLLGSTCICFVCPPLV